MRPRRAALSPLNPVRPAARKGTDRLTSEGRTQVYSKIMMPVDVAHPDRQVRALSVAADLAAHYDAEICYVTVTSAAPGALGHTPDDARARLAEFALAQSAAYGIKTRSHLALSHDPSTDLDKTLLAAIDETGADLVVMASHEPAWSDLLTGSHGGRLATHAKISVMVVRDA